MAVALAVFCYSVLCKQSLAAAVILFPGYDSWPPKKPRPEETSGHVCGGGTKSSMLQLNTNSKSCTFLSSNCLEST